MTEWMKAWKLSGENVSLKKYLKRERKRSERRAWVHYLKDIDNVYPLVRLSGRQVI